MNHDTPAIINNYGNHGRSVVLKMLFNPEQKWYMSKIVKLRIRVFSRLPRKGHQPLLPKPKLFFHLWDKEDKK